ncbi:MAG: endonuclease/exonuclease/phosphatase family protein [Pseudomonadota bacterium]
MDNLSIAWWNTSISPSKRRDRMEKKEYAQAIAIITMLINIYDLDMLCLGEVSPNNVNDLRRVLGDSFYIYDCTFKSNNSRIIHDMCVIYKKAKLIFIQHKDITKQKTTLGSIRAGLELQFQHIQSGQDFFLYMLHWPSRTTKGYEEDTNKRYELGATVRNAISSCLTEKNGKNYIVLGDFNDEPFNKSITEGLESTRDRKLLLRRPELLYNPFWRHVGHPVAFPNKGHDSMSCGTCYSSAELTTNWATFDQILFSSSFLMGNTWRLKEESVKIIRDFDLEDIIYDSNYFFDHLPVFAMIEGVTQ